jgi:hypothetical protein
LRASPRAKQSGGVAELPSPAILGIAILHPTRLPRPDCVGARNDEGTAFGFESLVVGPYGQYSNHPALLRPDLVPRLRQLLAES